MKTSYHVHSRWSDGKNDALPYEVGVTGEAAVGDTTQTARTFLLSNYNENISITAPQIQ